MTLFINAGFPGGPVNPNGDIAIIPSAIFIDENGNVIQQTPSGEALTFVVIIPKEAPRSILVLNRIIVDGFLAKFNEAMGLNLTRGSAVLLGGAALVP